MMNLTETVLYSCGISLFTSFGIQKVEAKRPNILFIMTDQQRYDMLSCAGNRYVHTPSLDQLAENGVRFERNYCANPVSIQSVTQAMTRLPPLHLKTAERQKFRLCGPSPTVQPSSLKMQLYPLHQTVQAQVRVLLRLNLKLCQTANPYIQQPLKKRKE